MKVKFWGVRGSIAVSGHEYTRTGGNTPCVEITHGDTRLILDGGTGLRQLGADAAGPVDATVLFTHVHWDHIQGVPFFAPAFRPDSNLRFVGFSDQPGTLREALDRQMKPPQFPVGLELLAGIKSFEDHPADQSLVVGPMTVTPLDLQHPDGVVAIRVDCAGRSVVFATDVEHGGTVDPRLLSFSAGADLLIHDAQFTEEEYLGKVGPSRKGWGHSTIWEAVAAAELSGAARLALFHHDPSRVDDEVAVMESWAKERFPAAFAARDGAVVTL